MSWTIEPVNSYEDITSAYEMHIKPAKALRSVVMLNCGGAVDLFEELRLYEKPELIVYVFDSHRPFHPNNIKNVNQVRHFFPAFSSKHHTTTFSTSTFLPAPFFLHTFF